jgi:hypothetical protein
MATIRQWVAWVERKIAGVVMGEGLDVALAEVVEGPQVVTFRLRLLRPSPAALRKLQGLGPAIAQAAQVDGVRITDTARGVLIELPSPAPKTPPAAALAQATQGLAVALGLDQWRRPVVADLDVFPNMAFIGPPGRGKTQAMKSTLFALASRNPARRLCYLIASQKRSDWQAFDQATGCIAVVSDPAEIALALEWAAGELLQERARDGVDSPAIVFVIDDLVALLQRSPGIVGPLGELATLGRGLRLFLMLGTQQAGSKSGMGSTLIDDNVACRVVYRSSSATAGARAAGAGGLGLDQLSARRGDALFVADRVERIATGFADDRLIAQLPAADWGPKPWSAKAATRSGARSEERSNLAIERPRTGRNWSERAVLPLVDPTVEGNDDQVVEGGELERGDVERAPLATLADRLLAGEKLNGNRPPTDVEAAALRDLFARLGSREKVYKAAWGFKNGKVAGWLNEVLSEANVEPVLSPEVAGDQLQDDHAGELATAGARLDLASPEGRRVFEQLQRAGLVRLPDASSLIQEGA